MQGRWRHRMLDLIQTPFSPAFKTFADDIATDCFICSPYITSEPVRMLVDTMTRKKLSGNVTINVLTDISYRTLAQGSTETSALLYLFDNHPKVRITYLPAIHAKVYIANQSWAIITSANFTRGGGAMNVEYGVKIRDRKIVRRIRRDMNEYRKLGVDITRDDLEDIHARVEEIRKSIATEQRAIAHVISTHSAAQHRIEDDLIRMRVKRRSVNAIFSETLLYLLSKRPATTQALHEHVRAIHRDLCDDDSDRMIDGRSFGKLWKHQVRSSQVSLRRAGSIGYDKRTRLWHKTRNP